MGDADMTSVVNHLLTQLAMQETVILALQTDYMATRTRVEELERKVYGPPLVSSAAAAAPARVEKTTDSACTPCGLTVRGVSAVPQADGRPAACLMCNKSYGRVGGTIKDCGAIMAGCMHWGYGADCGESVADSPFVNKRGPCGLRSQGRGICFACAPAL